MAQRPDILPILILLAAVLLFVGGYYLFPTLLHAVQHTDCVASGRTDCG
jgi:hypothetical protein